MKRITRRIFRGRRKAANAVNTISDHVKSIVIIFRTLTKTFFLFCDTIPLYEGEKEGERGEGSISDGLGGGKMMGHGGGGGGYKIPDAGWNYLVEVLGKCGHTPLLGKVGGHCQAKELLQNAD